MKILKTKADLAINGAAPLFADPIHVGRPNIGDKAKFQCHIEEMLDTGWLTNNGPLVQRFEKQVADYLGVRHCIAMCSGTIALEIAIRAVGMTGEVIIPSYTFVATAHALHWQGITPVFADINPDTHNLDPEAVRRMITPRTTGIIGVHLWGRPSPVEELQTLADEYGLHLMFDAAHAFGCSHQGQMIGRFGRAEVLSFHATKYFNTMEGGAVATNDDELADKIRLMRNFGFSGYDNVVHPGTNGKMIEACAAMGLVNLEGLESVLSANRINHYRYSAAISDMQGLRLAAYDEREASNYQYVVLEVGDDCIVSRDEIVAALHAENILARKYFWPGCHRMKPYRDLFPHAGLMLEHTEQVAAGVVVLPTGLRLRGEQQEAIISVLRLLTEP